MPDRALTCGRSAPSPMPSKPTWFHRLPEILDALRRMDSSNSSASPPPSRPAMDGRTRWHPGRHRRERGLSVGSGPPGPRRRRTGADPRQELAGPASSASGSLTPRTSRPSWWNCPRRWPMTGTVLCAPSRNARPLLRRPSTAKQRYALRQQLGVQAGQGVLAGALPCCATAGKLSGRNVGKRPITDTVFLLKSLAIPSGITNRFCLGLRDVEDLHAW